MDFYKLLDDYTSNGGDSKRNLPFLSFNLKRGEIIQVLHKEATHLQARKFHQPSSSGFVPSNLQMQRVSLLSPFGRRTLLLLGASGVGRRTLKSMLLNKSKLASQMATVVPLTSRAKREDEVEGREYRFERKESLLRKIRQGELIEWGEHDLQLYGTSFDSIREVMRSGRLCVLDCSPKALRHLYTSEFMPFVVAIAAPPLKELQQISQLNPNSMTVSQEELKKVCEASEKFLQGEWASKIDLVLVNRNRDVTMRRLEDALERMRVEPQWVPREWIG